MPFLRWTALLLCGAALAALDLAVLLPEGEAPVALERTLRRDPLCRGLDLRVLPKWRLLEDALAERPRLVIAPSGFALMPGWQAVLAGRRAEGASERLVLLAIDPAVRPDDPALIVGLAQTMPRSAAEAFIAGSFALRPGMVRLAARPDDAVAMLGLDLAQAVVATPAMAVAARSRFPSGLRELAVSVPVRLPMVFVPRGGDPAPGRALAGLGSATLAAMGLTAFAPPPDGGDTPWPAQPAKDEP